MNDFFLLIPFGTFSERDIHFEDFLMAIESAFLTCCIVNISLKNSLKSEHGQLIDSCTQ